MYTQSVGNCGLFTKRLIRIALVRLSIFFKFKIENVIEIGAKVFFLTSTVYRYGGTHLETPDESFTHAIVPRKRPHQQSENVSDKRILVSFSVFLDLIRNSYILWFVCELELINVYK